MMLIHGETVMPSKMVMTMMTYLGTVERLTVRISLRVLQLQDPSSTSWEEAKDELKINQDQKDLLKMDQDVELNLK
ncbi:hypothetical protein Y1Q_0002267 [Alligator mississippiensis]|uniref:Uncharacterized protein n=1 Tax=Alligator mississippiensis TaxID=8496 RepID=A0A151MGJ3_ALLMI|nr:hypothetical protein Y1Q_0002267 [Alligator mississippiensis]